MWQVIINVLAQQKKVLNSYFFYIIYYLTKKTNLGKSLLNFYKICKLYKAFFELIYIFFGLIILGINNTPKTNSNNGAIITKNDSVFIKT